MTKQSIRVPVYLAWSDGAAEALALIDSGAGGIFLDQSFVKTHRIPSSPLWNPIQVHNVDGTPNSNGEIRTSTRLELNIGDKVMSERFLITNLGKEEIILGLPWLQKQNPAIDWKTGGLTINNVDTQELNDDALDNLDYFDVSINRTINPATTFAQQTKEEDRPLWMVLPHKFSKFASVFQKPKTGTLPPNRAYDHAIELKPDFQPRAFKAYSLNQKEERELDDFISENLEKGLIRPSKSPMASPFFFVPKKSGASRPCQDYR